MIKILAAATGIAYRHLVRPFLFRRDPEKIHERAIKAGEILGKNKIARHIFRQIYRFEHPSLEQTINGIKFKNPVGLAAGFDKDGRMAGILEPLGFGSAEVGSMTWRSYEGNPKPRLYRLIKSKGIVVNYGLKSAGVEAVGRNLSRQQRLHEWPLGISIAKTNSPETVEEQAGIEDYQRCLARAAELKLGAWYTLNISCPNTFGGEPFTEADSLDRLLEAIESVRPAQPLWLKMPINLPWQEFKLLLDTAVKYQIKGVIIGNLNKNHQDPAIKEKIPPQIKGGISGRPSWNLSNDLIRRTFQAYGDKLTIIGAGGIFSAADAYEKIKFGASLIQLVTGMIFEGPQLAGQINRQLTEYLKRDNYTNISQAVGKQG